MSPEHLRAFLRTHEWQEVRRLIQERSTESQRSLRRMDPLKDATSIARQQGRLEVFELLLDTPALVEAVNAGDQ